MRGIGRQSSVDFGAYARAVPLYFRNPALALAPLIVSLIGLVLIIISPPGSGPLSGLSGGITSLLVQLIDSFGLAISVILAASAWRRGRASFSDAWDEGRRKAGDILMAALGYTFLIYVAGLVGGFVGGLGSIALSAVAMYFFIYTIPAAAIGGIPGGAALQVSIERVQSSYLNSLLLAIVFAVFAYEFTVVWGYAAVWLATLSDFFANTIAVQLIGAVIKALGLGYLALVMAKAYNDVSYRRIY